MEGVWNELGDDVCEVPRGMDGDVVFLWVSFAQLQNHWKHGGVDVPSRRQM